MKEVRMQALVDVAKCAGCNTCIYVCPTMAYTQRKVRPIKREKLPPCNANCPAGNDIEGFVSLLQEEKWDDAVEILNSTNPFPAVTGRVCNSPCEGSCNRGQFDQSVSIKALERVLGDYAAYKSQKLYPNSPRYKERIAIIGSGPAGLSCAYFLARQGFRVTVFEQKAQIGGVLRYGIPSYRLPKYVLDREVKGLKELGVGFKLNQKFGDNLGMKDFEGYDAIYLALGFHKSRRLGIPGEDSNQVIAGLAFLEQMNSGNGLELGSYVVIVGGGNSAIDSARTSLRLGKHTTLLYRRREEDMPAIRSEVEEMKKEGVQIHTLTTPVRFIFKDGRLAEILCVKMDQGEMETDGRREPIAIPGSEFTIPADTVVLCVGETGDLEGFPGDLKLVEERIHVDAYGRSSIPKVFAGGDISTGFGTVAHAIGSGHRGAQCITAYLLGESDTNLTCEKDVVNASEMNFDYYDKVPRLISPRISMTQAISSFEEIYQTASITDSILEASRCVHCGVTPEFRPEYCLGCNNCTDRCPSHAITLNELDSPFFVNVIVEDTIMEQVRKLCERAGFHPESIICACTSTRAMEIAGAIIKGAKTPEDISRMTGARTGCTVVCIESIFRLLMAAGIELGQPRQPHLWYPTVPTLWEISENVIKKYENRGFRFKEDKAWYEKRFNTAKNNLVVK